ncbi:MAG: DUF1642 domain-containing protein [Tetragenococcus koreensis]|nr:DUF1642 domain-containing protein [Tetragenococcus koreensis]MDN6185299.1 DUF1642 domain-containing protein [Tetragenococcus halophilus]MDN6728781.1 DUF1642 domain-containing protein [Alkalibacterium sp.]MDN6267192.1 DUF1642 domain-containing protein [Tetragenococcus koreensis]MDN6709932.1 DUF1642 domain-containing protein [Tetragenococcus halophilus]
MTKFEEELEKLPIKIIQHPVGDTKYYAAVHVKSLIAQADEEFQELLSKYSGLNDNYEKEVIRSSKLESQIIDLKSQLQQQALPVVPEEVDKAIKYLKTQNNFATLSDLGDILTEKGFWWLNDFQFKDRRFGFGGLNNKLFILSHLAITGYQVEKPQLFYIDLPKVFGLSDSTSDSTFVSKAESGIILEFTKGKDYALKLTEQEIKSIDERYWQFAVPVEDGE